MNFDVEQFQISLMYNNSCSFSWQDSYSLNQTQVFLNSVIENVPASNNNCHVVSPRYKIYIFSFTQILIPKHISVLLTGKACNLLHGIMSTKSRNGV